MNFFQPISISLSPNTERDDILLALKLIFQPWRWLSGNKSFELEERFKKYLGISHAFSFNSGRSGLMAIFYALKEMGIVESQSEVLLQAFTCNAASNPVIWSGLKPVYVDCSKETLNIDIEDLKRKIAPRSRAVIVQHTFGLPADVKEVLDICQKNSLILIEDCAHSLGAEYSGKKTGTFGDASFFSFSRDKIISSVYGGMAVTNNKEMAGKIKEFQEKIGRSSLFWIKQQLLHPLLMNLLILPTYRILGKYLLVIFQRLNILSRAVHFKEKRGEKPSYFPKRMPDALAILALNQFKKIERFNWHRKEIAELYYKELSSMKYKMLDRREGNIFLRFPVFHPEAHRIIEKAWDNNLLIGDWYTFPLAPRDTKLDRLQYALGSCPNAEKLSKETFNLPTHINISKERAKKIVDFLNNYAD